ncbi:MAG: NUMOD3 domain-containing DNA-binding protein [Bacteroidales bacterium]|jgi:hypothetical protein
MKIVSSSNWLNRSLAGQQFFNDYCSEEHKLKISNTNKGKTHTKETKNKISLSSSGKPKSKVHKNNISLAKTGILKTDEQKQNMSNSSKNREKFECEFCHQYFTKNLLSRWHNDKCKHKNLF